MTYATAAMVISSFANHSRPPVNVHFQFGPFSLSFETGLHSHNRIGLGPDVLADAVAMITLSPSSCTFVLGWLLLLVARSNTYCDGLYTSILSMPQGGYHSTRFTFKNVDKTVVATPYNRLAMICKCHFFGIRFDRVSGDESAHEIPGI